MNDKPLKLGDMMVSGAPPAKLIKAAAVIAEALHPNFERLSLRSRDSCVLSSLAVRDFLFKIGFRSAEVVPVVFVIRADQDGKELHSLGIGDPYDKGVDAAGRWSGHMVARLPDEGFLIDTTLFQAARPQWPALPGMVLLPLAPSGQPVFGLSRISGFEMTADDGRAVVGMWLEQPRNKRWRGAPDTGKRRREPVVGALVERFGSWSN